MSADEPLEPEGRQERIPVSEADLPSWLRDRSPPIPDAFLPFLVEGRSGPVDPARLIEWGLRALSRALEKPGRVRAAAFDLLVADAFLTYACEAMAASGDVGAGLESLIGQLGTRLG